MLRWLVLLAGTTVAMAQEQPPPPSPETQVLSTRLVQEINKNIACEANTITLQHQIADLKAQIAKLSLPKEPPKK